MAQFDLVVRGGTLADGLGGTPFDADVAIQGACVAQVGRVSGVGRAEIDARGKLVTPGFVDIHTHYDGQAVWDSHLAPSSWHGVTTAVMGNCGVGFAPVRPGDRQRLVELMEGVEDIPGAALHEGLDWSWESFEQYLEALAARPHDMDLCAQLPHGALRVFVMGERGARLEKATPDDIAQMRALAARAMHAGAIGFSTSRTLNHRSVHGEPTPSLRASEDELTAIALGLRDAGRGVIEFISDFDTPDAPSEFAMVRRIVSASQRPLSVSLAQRHGRPRFWRELLAMIEAAAADGLPIKAQVAPRPIGVLLGLQGSRTPFSRCPRYQSIAERSLADKVATMRESAFRAQLLREAQAPLPRDQAIRLRDYRRMYTFGDPPNYEPPAEASVAAIAERNGCTPAEAAYDLLLADEGRAFLYAPFANYAEPNLDVCHEMLRSEHTLVGLGDGGAHVGVIADASYPTFLLSHWGRDRASGRFPLGWLVRRHTLDNARAVGLHDRGCVLPGMKADLNVIDMDKLGLDAPVMAYDLPAGGKRLLQRARGYAATIVSGQVVNIDGEHTGALPGALVRGPQRAPASAAA